MPYDERVANRIRECLSVHPGQVVERKMMGGFVFMLNGHMCCGASGDGLMVRIGPDSRRLALKKPHVHPLNIGNGRSPSAFVRIDAAAVATKRSLQSWIAKGIAFVETLPERPVK